MNFISTNHQGGIGNVMFKLAAAISLALDNNIEYIFSNEFIRTADHVATKGFNDYRVYYNNILRNINFIPNLPNNYSVFSQVEYHYKPIPYVAESNLLLMGYYQSEKYFINNKQTIIDLYKPSDNIKQDIRAEYANIDLDNCVSIHVRRGDYLYHPNHHPIQTAEYYQSATNILGFDNTYLIFSDDIEGCKYLFDFLPNKIFIPSGYDWHDMYLMSMCKHNIICNSTFSWWAAYINENVDKQIIAPKKWFGSAYSNWDTSDLIPSDWLIINK